MVVFGTALIAYAWIDAHLTRTVAEVATATAAPVAPRGPEDARRFGVLLLRGTPADDDSASEEVMRDYSQRLGGLVAEALARPPAAISLETRTLDAEQWKALRAEPSTARQWCRETPPVEFVAAVGLPALRLPDGVGYAPWREPEEYVVACGGEARASHRGRVNERLGDRIPYEQALTEELRAVLARIGIASTR